MKYGHYCSINDIYHMPNIKIPSFKNECFNCLLCAKEHVKEYPIKHRSILEEQLTLSHC